MTPVEVTVSGPSFFQTLLAVLLGAAIGAAGSIVASLIAVKRQLRGAAAQSRKDRAAEREEDALVDLLGALVQLRALVRHVLPSHRPGPGEPLKTILWVRTQELSGEFVRRWTELIAPRLHRRDVRDAEERLAGALLATEAAYNNENPPPDEFWEAIDQLGDAIEHLRTTAEAALGEQPD